ncbi:MAG: sulfurtransferase TusA family protein [Dehalococcoidia bacterium]|nr:sulfurtransferase TusA family protein [Dehalococcoidia bacterium]
MAEMTAAASLDTCGKICPEPNIMIKDKLPEIKPGEILEVVGDVPNKRSMERFVRFRGHELVSSTVDGDIFTMLVRRAENERTDIPLSQCTFLNPGERPLM